MLIEMNDTLGLVLLSLGVDISTISSFAEADEAFAKLEQAKADGQIRAFTGNDYLARPRVRELRRLRRLVGRRRSALGRQPQHPLRHPRGGRAQLGRHDADAQGRRASRRGGAVDGLRLRPGAGGPDHGVGAVHLAGQGRPGGGRQDRSGARREPVGLPRRGDARQRLRRSPTSTRKPRRSSTKPVSRSSAPRTTTLRPRRHR